MDELVWDEYIILVMRLYIKFGKKEYGGGNGEGRCKGLVFGNIL